MLAILKRETGAESVRAVLDRATISTVNLAEVQGKLVSAGLDRHTAWERITFLGCRAASLDEPLARETGSLIAETRAHGLSLGDRACLALAMERKARVYTTDKAWKNLSLGIEVEVIR